MNEVEVIASISYHIITQLCHETMSERVVSFLMYDFLLTIFLQGRIICSTVRFLILTDYHS